MSKGSHRRPEDTAAIEKNWPFPEKAVAQADGDPAKAPYPWCRQPDVCRGYCPRDPNCGE